jgi:hypothetical protein
MTGWEPSYGLPRPNRFGALVYATTGLLIWPCSMLHEHRRESPNCSRGCRPARV